MGSLLPRAFAIGRQALQQPAVRSSITQQACLVPTAQTAWFSFKTRVNYGPNPTEVPINPNHKDKISPKKRAIKRPFVPPPTKTEEELAAAFPYLVRRTPYLQLPVYRKFMSGGTRIVILVKKVDGDRAQFVEDLMKGLELSSKDIRTNPVTQHVEIKGNHFEKTTNWLLEAGF